MTALNDTSTVGARRSLNVPPAGGTRRAGSVQRPASGPQRPAQPQPQAAPEQAASPRPAAPQAGSAQPATGNIDTTLRDRINRLSQARNNLLRRRSGNATIDESVATSAAQQMQPAETSRPETHRPEAVPAFEIPEDIEIETTEARDAQEVDLTGAGTASRQDTVSPSSTARQQPVTDDGAGNPRQSARRRTPEEQAAQPCKPVAEETAGLPVERRTSSPDVARSAVREVAGPARGDESALKAEIETLRRELADMRREVRALREAGPGGLGPVERAVQRLAQRMDRIDGGAQPMIADGQLEQRKPKRSGLLGLFSGRR